ncbi:MAG TPA: gliding motility-associated C-terminal domain-containing protein [Puia sp.]|nr:gliding motility-associated C-terminal domain-containing protein [Puia sp.]
MLPRGSVLLLSLSVWISSTCWEKTLAQSPAFQLNISTTHPTCQGDQGIIVVKPSGGTAPYSYSFDGSPPQYSGILSVGDGTIHYIEVTDAMGTKVTTSVTMPAGAEIPSITVTNVTPISGCGATDGVISVQGAGGSPPYTFSLDKDIWSYRQDFVGLSAGAYLIYVRDSKGCMQFIAKNLQDCVNPALSVGNSLCGSGGVINIMVSNINPPYTYSLNGQNYQSSGTFTQLTPQTFTVHIRDGSGTVSLCHAVVFDQCKLQVTAQVQEAGCGRQDAKIFVNPSRGKPPYIYSIDGVNFQSSNTFEGLVVGRYSVLVTDADGSQEIVTMQVADNCQYVLSATTDPTVSTCGKADATVAMTATGGTAPYQYNIDGGAFQNSNVFTSVVPGTHHLSVEDAAGAVFTIGMQVQAGPGITADGGADVPVCEGQSAQIMATSSGTSFSWQPTTGLDDATLLQPRASPTTNTTYTLTARTGSCEATAVAHVIVHPAPVGVIDPVGAICPGQSTQLHASGGSVYSWSPSLYLDDTTIPDPLVQQPDHTITYQLDVKDGNGCTSLQAVTVTVNVTAPPMVYIGRDTSILKGQPLPLHAVDINNTGFDSWSWNPPEGLDNAHGQAPVAYPVENTMYTVIASTASGCSATAHIGVKVFSMVGIFVPSAFTPNGDGHNDVLRAIPMGIRDFGYFAVWNRWGQRVFYTTDPAIGWDGTIGGRPGEAGAFIWKVSGADYKGDKVQREGTVFLIR